MLEQTRAVNKRTHIYPQSTINDTMANTMNNSEARTIVDGAIANSTPSGREIREGKRTLMNLLQTGRISEADVAYIKVATDPWHDTKVEGFDGIPDNFQGASITEPQTMTKTIKTPYAPGSGNWSCRVVTYPFVGKTHCTQGYAYGQNVWVSAYVPGVTGRNYASVTIDFSATDDFSLQAHAEYMYIDSSVATGDLRIAGAGLEVVNTTSELHKQGLMTSARIPQTGSAENRSYFVTKPGVVPVAGASPLDSAYVDCQYVQSAPTTLSELTKYPGNVSWAAAEGQYSVIGQYGAGSEKPRMANSGVMVYNRATPSVGPLQTEVVWAPYLTTQTAGSFSYSPLAQQETVIPAPCDMIVTMYTGLSEDTTLTFKYRQLCERRVNVTIPEEAALVPLSHNSPPYNPAVIELVAALWTALPPAVMFKENPEGEWWDRIMSGIGDIALPILGSIPHPVAQGLAGAGRMLLGHRNEDRALTREEMHSSGEGRHRNNDDWHEKYLELRRQIERESNFEKRARAKALSRSTTTPKKPAVKTISAPKGSRTHVTATKARPSNRR